MATIALLALADVVTTYLGLNGRDDANPFVAGLLRDHGYSGLVVAKAMLVVLALLVTRLRPEVRRLAWVMVIPCFAVGPVWNLLVMAGFRWP